MQNIKIPYYFKRIGLETIFVVGFTKGSVAFLLIVLHMRSIKRPFYKATA
jgi:hypothetical protein